MRRLIGLMALGIFLLPCDNSLAQGVALSNFGIYEKSLYKEEKLSKSRLSANDLNLAGLSKTINAIPSTLLSYTINPDEENRDALFDCEGNLTSLWKQYQKSCRDKGTKINYLELYGLWEKKDKFCSDLLDKISLKLYFNFISPGPATYYLQRIIVQKLAYPGTRGSDEMRDWASGFQRENGFQLVAVAPSLKTDTIILDRPLIIEKQGTLKVNFSSRHYQYLIPGSLQQGNYILKLKFVFSDGSMQKHVANTPVFHVKL